MLTTAALLGALTLSGCASFAPPAGHAALESGKSYWFNYDASRRGAIFVPGDQKIHYCAEPSPDVAVEFINRLLVEVNSGDAQLDAKAQAELQSKIIALAGRTSTVTFLREALYRLCEQSINGNLSGDQIGVLYEKALDTAIIVAQTDLADKNKEVLELLRDPEIRRTFSQMFLKEQRK